MTDQHSCCGKAKKTVVHIAPTPFFADRGCHIRIRNEIEALSPFPYKIILCTYHHGRDIKGIDTRRTWRIPGYSKLDAGYSPFRFLADFLLFFLVLKIVWQERPSLLHCHLHEGALIGWAVKQCLFWRNMLIIMDMQGSLSGELAAYSAFGSLSFPLHLFRKMEEYICRMPDFFLCSSQESRSCLYEDFKVDPAKTLFVQDIVPDIFFAITSLDFDTRREELIPSHRTVILYTGSLLPGKGVRHILEDIRELSAQREDLFFLLAGYPVDAAQEYLISHHLEQCCLLPGRVDYAELADWLALGDIALEPKEADSGEASGKLLHYMAAGLPVVCFDTANNRSMLGDAGYFAPTCDAQGLITGINAALEDMELARRRGEEGRMRVRERYSSAAVGRILHRVYGRFAAMY